MASKDGGTNGSRAQPADFHRSGSSAVSQPGPARQARSRRHQADGDAARPLACLFARRRRAGSGHRRGRGARLRLHDQGQFRRRHHQRYRHSGPRQSRRAGGQAGDGRQGGSVQALRRHRLRSISKSPPKIPTKSSIASSCSARAGAASISRTSRRRNASSSSRSCANCSTSRFFMTISTAPPSSPPPA